MGRTLLGTWPRADASMDISSFSVAPLLRQRQAMNKGWSFGGTIHLHYSREEGKNGLDIDSILQNRELANPTVNMTSGELGIDLLSS